MPPGIDRNSQSETLTIASGAALSGVFDFRAFANGVVIVPGTWTDANLGFYVCDTVDGTFVPLVDDAGAPIQISGIATNKSKAYALPDQLFPCKFVKLWSKSTTAATETDTNQGAARSLVVMKKG